MTTESVLTDTGAIDSDYVSSMFVESLEGLGYKIDANVLDKVETPSEHLPAITCLGIVSLNVPVYNELKKEHEVIQLEARVIDSQTDDPQIQPVI